MVAASTTRQAASHTAAQHIAAAGGVVPQAAHPVTGPHSAETRAGAVHGTACDGPVTVGGGACGAVLQGLKRLKNGLTGIGVQIGGEIPLGWTPPVVKKKSSSGSSAFNQPTT